MSLSSVREQMSTPLSISQHFSCFQTLHVNVLYDEGAVRIHWRLHTMTITDSVRSMWYKLRGGDPDRRRFVIV